LTTSIKTTNALCEIGLAEHISDERSGLERVSRSETSGWGILCFSSCMLLQFILDKNRCRYCIVCSRRDGVSDLLTSVRSYTICFSTCDRWPRSDGSKGGRRLPMDVTGRSYTVRSESHQMFQDLERFVYLVHGMGANTAH
jgi:hypothetical protein